MAQKFAQPKLVDSLVSGNTAFAIDLYKELCKADAGKNIFFSPISISLALSMTYLGAANKTATEMKQSLGLAKLEDAQLHEAYKDLNTVLQSADQTYALRTANRIFARQSYKFKQDFLDATRKFYNAEAQVLDFQGNAEGSRTTINKWVEDQTAEKIKELMPAGSINALTAMVLVNAIYFKGNWEEKFDPKKTKAAKFKLESGSEVDIQLMYQKWEKMGYGESEELDCQIVEVPYVKKDLSMFILLPKQQVHKTLEELEKRLTPDALEELMSQMGPIDVHLHLPRFKLEHSFSVKSMLQNLGMKDGFTEGAADFSNMDGTRQMYISDVVHKSYIDVNEEGTEAAAATGIKMMLMCMPIEMDFRADHPFLFLIRENRSKGILFMGRVNNPA